MAAIDFNQDFGGQSPLVEEIGCLASALDGVDTKGDVGAIHQARDPFKMVLGDGGVGDPYVIESSVYEALGFGRFRDRDPRSTLLALKACQIDRFMGFDVRSEAYVVVVGSGLHPGQVAFETRLLDQQGRGRKISD
jgi:hypothetical protein